MRRTFARLLLVFALRLAFRTPLASGDRDATGRGGRKTGGRTCVPITVPMCRGIGYNMTRMPNQLRHSSQDEAGLEVHQFWPLVEIRCSPDLRFFLCSVYVPICVLNYRRPLPACRAVCERARAGCLPIMRQYGFAWPERMRCDALPVFGDPDRLCMDFNTTGAASMRPTPPGRRRGPYSAVLPTRPPACRCRCRAPYVRVVNGSSRSSGGVPACAAGCDAAAAHLNGEQRAFGRLWLGVWATLCCLTTAATVATYAVDRRRFRYPERPVVFLSGCCCLASVGYLVRLVAGHDAVACTAGLMRQPDTGPPSPLCLVVFLLLYFFGMAAALWWLVLALGWFFATALKWGEEAISACSAYFHLAAWLAAAVQTVTALGTSAVDGDTLSGVCYVGGQDARRLRWLVIAPLSVYLLTGCLLLGAGFVSLFRIRRAIRLQQPAGGGGAGGGAGPGTLPGGGADKLDKLMVRLAIFAVLYALPAGVVIACHVYELRSRPRSAAAYGCQCAGATVTSRPLYAVFMLKHFAAAFVGIASGVWIWSAKTLHTWRRFYERVCGCAVQHKYAPPPPPQRATSSQLSGRVQNGGKQPCWGSRQLSEM